MGRLWTATIAVGLFTLLGTLFSIFMGIAEPATQWDAEVKRFASSLISQKANRYADDVYLSGAGKADITGYEAIKMTL
ncbi:hypothetical protein KEM54_002581, partial [Ascosphaera aggregata]